MIALLITVIHEGVLYHVFGSYVLYYLMEPGNVAVINVLEKILE